MLRIVGVQRSEAAETEFVLLQNQGCLRVVLKGHVIVAERAIVRGDLCDYSHVFSEDESIHPGLYALLSTGFGVPHWGKTKDGSHVYHAYAGREEPVWHACEGTIHLLSPTHSYCERPETLVLR